MKTKVLITILGGLLLTACGGGGNGSGKDSFETKEKVDYTKPETIESIYESIINLSNPEDNIVLIGSQFAEELYYNIQAGYDFKCSTGSYTKNSDYSLTFNECRSFLPDNGAITIAGTINSREKLSTDSARYDTTLTNFIINPSNTVKITYNGNILSQYSNSKAQHQITKMTLSAYDAETKKTEHLLINKYLLDINDFNAIAQGNIEGNPDNKIFNVNFRSEFNFSNNDDKQAFYPSFAKILIEDRNNPKNSITITNTTDYKALINAYADGNSVIGFPKVLNWNEIN